MTTTTAAAAAGCGCGCGPCHVPQNAQNGP